MKNLTDMRLVTLLLSLSLSQGNISAVVTCLDLLLGSVKSPPKLGELRLYGRCPSSQKAKGGKHIQ